MAFAPGDVIDGKLRLERELGGGAVGSVWAAEHVRLGSRVAVKILGDGWLGQPQVAKRFLNEARTLAQIHSPNIVTVHDCSLTAEGRPFIVMELLHGENLSERIARLGPRPLAEARDILSQLCNGLEAAHEKSFIHRDIKPANLLLVATQQGFVVKLLDFGIAKDPDMKMTGDAAVLGTPAYMSPEQLDHPHNIDHRADLWSAAAVIYECLVGRPPFEGETVVRHRMALLAGTFPKPTELRPELPRSLDGWFAQAFDQRIEARFQSAAALLSSFLQASPIDKALSVPGHERDLPINPTMVQPVVAEAAPREAVPLRQIKATVPLAAQPESPPAPADFRSTVDDPFLSSIPVGTPNSLTGRSVPPVVQARAVASAPPPAASPHPSPVPPMPMAMPRAPAPPAYQAEAAMAPWMTAPTTSQRAAATRRWVYLVIGLISLGLLGACFAAYRLWL